MSSPPIQKHESYTGGYDPLILGALARREAVREAAFFVPFLKPKMRILDCGCGSHRFCRRYAGVRTPASLRIEFFRRL